MNKVTWQRVDLFARKRNIATDTEEIVRDQPTDPRGVRLHSLVVDKLQRY